MALPAEGKLWAEICSTGHEHAKFKTPIARNTYTAEVAEAALKFATPFFAWEWGRPFYVLLFGGWLDGDGGFSRL